MKPSSQPDETLTKANAAKAGFTLIELMIVVAILGTLAAIAIPAFSVYLRRSRSAEAGEQLRQIFMNVAAYYHPDRQSGAGIAGELDSACAVDSVNNNINPNPSKQAGDYSAAGWRAIHYEIGFSYFRYEIVSPGGARCQVPRETVVYYLQGSADLDGDNTKSTYQLAVASDASNYLYHARGFYIVNENE